MTAGLSDPHDESLRSTESSPVVHICISIRYYKKRYMKHVLNEYTRGGEAWDPELIDTSSLFEKKRKQNPKSVLGIYIYLKSRVRRVSSRKVIF